MRRIALLTAALAGVLAVGACRDEEQNRPLAYSKSNYAGKPDTPLSPAAQEALRERVHRQGALGEVTVGAQTVPQGGDVRPPGAPPAGGRSRP